MMNSKNKSADLAQSKNSKFDVIVIGGGHAGIEAAYAAANLGSKTLLITLDNDKLAMASCNPSIGGLGKGHIVYEIAAFSGIMPKICSQTCLQARMLNTKKGPAVQGLRIQIDKYKYPKVAKQILSKIPNLEIFEGMVTQVFTTKNSEGKNVISGVGTKCGERFSTTCLVITAGTFLNGLIHVGMENWPGGRNGEEACVGLSESLEKVLGVKLGRLKTGTPPRILKNSVDYAKLEKQVSHSLDFLYEFEPVQAQEKIPCYITNTNEKTHKIIKDNFSRSALFGGNIIGTGPRYCPSIELKIERFPDRALHHVFIEPEGEWADEVYPSGISTSLPIDVQNDYVRSIKGLEKAVITKPGYAIEYDFLQPTHLKHSLETKNLEGLFFAGQVNGTTGYEEAAGQGLIAGINASLKWQNKEPFILSRYESYIGIMIDDLVTIGVDEPYRMFTSRAERRLLLRQDNTFLRLMPYAQKLGLISESTYENFLQEKNVLEKSVELVEKSKKSDELFKLFASIEFTNEIRDKAKELLLLKWQEDKYSHLFENGELEKLISSRVLLGVHAAIKYSGYLQRELREIQKTKKYKSLEIPNNFQYKKMPGLSIELQEKLTRLKPKNIEQAQLIPGMTPAAISLLIFQTKLASQTIKN